MKKLFLASIILLFLSACVSTKNVPLDSAKIEQWQPSQLTLSKRNKPDFAAQTAGKAVFGAIGAVAMITAGNKIINENEVQDPANYIGDELAKALAEKYGVANVVRSDSVVKGLKEQAVIEAYPNSGLLIDVQTINWSFGYFPTKWGKYRVIYSAKLRLIDGDAGTLLAEGFCSRVPKYDETAPTKDELLGDSAARLKKELSIAANDCIKQLKANVLQL